MDDYRSCQNYVMGAVKAHLGFSTKRHNHIGYKRASEAALQQRLLDCVGIHEGYSVF